MSISRMERPEWERLMEKWARDYQTSGLWALEEPPDDVLEMMAAAATDSFDCKSLDYQKARIEDHSRKRAA